MIDVIPVRIMELIREADEDIRKFREEEEARKLAEKMALEAESERIKQVFLNALPEELRNYADFSDKRVLTKSLLDLNEFVIIIKVPGLFPMRACLYRDQDEWYVDVYQIATWHNDFHNPTFDDARDDPDFRNALWIAKTLVDEARRSGGKAMA